MAQDIVVTYRAEVDQLTSELKKLIAAQEAITNEQKDGQKELQKNLTAQEYAAKKRLELLKLEEQELKKLKQLRALAFDPKTISDYDKKISQSEKNIQLLSKTTKKSLGDTGSAIKSIGAGIATALGAAFTVDAVIQFGKASVNAFLEAQENAEKLRFTITQVGGESEAAFQRLIDQSKQLQDITIFSDDSIQQAQTALSTFGLTADEIEKLLPLLTDFASVTKTDIVSAANQVGQGLQGAGRELKKFGIDVSATGTKMENLAEITKGFSQFQGAAAKETETLSGQLKRQANAAQELQENIGSRLAESFVNSKLAAFEFFKTVLDGFDGLKKANADLETSDRNRLKARIEADLQAKTTVNNLTLEEQAKRDLIKTGDRLNNITSDSIEALKEGDTERIERLKRERSELIKTAGILNEIIQLEEDRTKNAAKPLEKTQAQLDEEKRLAAELLKNQQNLRKLQIANIEDLKAQRIAIFEEETKALTSQGKLRSDTIIEMEKQLVRDLNEIDKQRDFSLLQPIQPEVDFTVPPVETINPIPDTLELPPVDAGEFNDSIEAVEAKTLAGWLDNNAKMLDATTNLVNSLLGLWDLYTQKQIEDIQKVTDQQLTNLDEQGKANQDSLNKRRITETEFAILQEKLEKQKVQAQEDADKKIRALKRKQAIADKAAALIQIAIDTARAYAETIGQTGIFGIPLGAIVLAAGAAQAAIVAATPIPYRRGSKDTGAKGHMAKVGEEGEEIVYMPAHSKVLPAHRTRTYGDVLDKMFEGTFDKHYMKRDISSSLVSQRRNFEEKKEKSFAQNIKESIIYQQTGLTEYELERVRRRGQNVTNANEIGQSVARAISQTIDIYRR